jgi:Uncharacterised ArCR, COG2043
MDHKVKEKFLEYWAKYFDKAELPLTFYYSAGLGTINFVPTPGVQRCLIGDLMKARKGMALCFAVDSLGCSGAKRYLGFTTQLRPEFNYFLSCGIPGRVEGERYKKSPEIVDKLLKHAPTFTAPAPYVIVKRWDLLEESDNPEVVIFFAHPDILSGLFTLSGFEEYDTQAVMAPFGAGCGTIFQYPYLEKDKDNPKGVLGMFDVSARPYVGENILTFAVPMKKFNRMIETMPESFLITGSWEIVQKRIKEYLK